MIPVQQSEDFPHDLFSFLFPCIWFSVSQIPKHTANTVYSQMLHIHH